MKTISVESTELALNKLGIRTRTRIFKRSRPLRKVLLDISKKWDELDENELNDYEGVFAEKTDKTVVAQRVGEFEKVSVGRFMQDIKPMFGEETGEDFMELACEAYNNIRIPERATSGSAGYDFKLPIGIVLCPGETMKIPTGIRVKIDKGWWLGCLPRSSLGFKYRLQLDNTMGVIDSDYYYSDNEGHIFAKITNNGGNGVLSLKEGTAFMQGIFLPYGITYSDNAQGVRNGGMGSTDKE